MFRIRVMRRLRFPSCVLTLLSLALVGAHAQTPVSPTGWELPTTEVKLDARAAERVLAARTVAVLARSAPFATSDGGDLRVTYRGRRTGPESAKADVERVLSEWGAFTVVADPSKADLVLVIAEQTLGPTFASNGKVRLRDTLAVFPAGGPGSAFPLWVGITTESALAAATGLTQPDAEAVAQKFRRDVEAVRSRVEAARNLKGDIVQDR